MSRGFVGRCNCGVPLALLKSSTVDNPSRRFLTCKFSNPAANMRGCGFFKWYDEDQTDWQKDLINTMILEKKILECDLKMLKCENAHLQEHCKKLKEANDLIRNLRTPNAEEESVIRVRNWLSFRWIMFVCVGVVFVSIMLKL